MPKDIFTVASFGDGSKGLANGEDCIPDHVVDRGFGETAVEKVVSALVNRVMPDGAALLAKAHWEHRQANFVLLEPTNLLPDHPLCCSANILSK
jgi:hypothetical protein